MTNIKYVLSPLVFELLLLYGLVLKLAMALGQDVTKKRLHLEYRHQHLISESILTILMFSKLEKTNCE